MDYPYNSPLILTDTLFENYGGQTGTSTSFQRQAAYLLAEIKATDELGTFLAPTVVTGTYPYPFSGKILVLPYNHIRGVYSVTPQSPSCYANCDLLQGTGCAFELDDGGWGYLIIRNTSYLSNKCGCGTYPYLPPINVQIAYQTGLVSGTSYLPNILLGLTMVAQIYLNEIIDPGANEGGRGDPGVTSWTSNGHMEVRKMLADTVFGNSAAAQQAARMFAPMRPKRALKLGW